ncbi:hypothetical protein [Novipirellula galeiformis]|uniref:hypothetical protein n=1 Tax=Novipirellula galeiformis TaxID=2528004 RepID=UPI0011B77F8E|nr:hypothetical protein [Novipirellula galeiformis]
MNTHEEWTGINTKPTKRIRCVGSSVAGNATLTWQGEAAHAIRRSEREPFRIYYGVKTTVEPRQSS